MKEDKFCLSKSVAFIAVVAFILVGVVVFTNYMNSQKVGGTPKAGVSNCTDLKGAFCTSTACDGVKAAQGGILDYVSAGGDCGDPSLNCCVASAYPTAVPVAAGALTCRDQGGDWYNDASCSDLSSRTNMVFSDPPAVVSDPQGTLKCCVKGNWPSPAAGQKSCVDQEGQWFPKATYPACTDIGGYEAVTAAGGGFLEGKAWDPTYNCCKPVAQVAPSAAPTLPAGSKTCKEFGGDWFNKQCDTITGASYVAVVPTSPAEISDKAAWSGSFCCKPKTTPATETCGYFTGERCFTSATYGNCAAVKTALGGDWKDTPLPRTSCGQGKICCSP